MSDELDDAQRRDQLHRERALANALAAMPHGVGRADCEDCEDPIPAARRRAVPTCTRCITCQTAFDHQQRQFAR
jgi:phage/conjugal plasmid C-4 type zinc finger TraR family protein